MESIYIEETELCRHDEKINALVKKIQSGPEGGGKPMTIAIQNETGVVYRVLTSWGMGQYISVTQGLLNLGLKDIYADNMNPPDYDSLFIFA